MPQTVPYGFEYESPDDEPNPGRTLSGAAGSPVTAEQINDELLRVEGTVIAGIDSRLTVAEAAAAASVWRGLASGTESGAAFDIPVPAGFDILRLYLFGDLDGSGTVRLRINGDSTAGLHEAGMISHRPDTGAIVDALSTAGATTAWLANWGTVSGNTVEATIFCPNAAGAPSWTSIGVRHSASPGGGFHSKGWGHCTSDRTVSSLNIRPFSDNANVFATCHWWLEGRITP